MAIEPESGCVVANFNYLKWNDIYATEKPYTTAPLQLTPDGRPPTNIEYEKGPEEKVWDIRNLKRILTLDENGFVYRRLQSSMTIADFASHEKIEKVLLAEYEQLIRREIPGVKKLGFFDWRIRGSDIKDISKIDGAEKGGNVQGAANFVHVDFSTKSAVKHALKFVDDTDRDTLMAGRFRILNIWKPIDGPVEDCPLAICDWTSVNRSKLIKFDTIRPTYTGEYIVVVKDPSHSWHYMSHQTDEDVTLFKSFDSKEGTAIGVPHSAFNIPNLRPGARPRKSIEVRVVVFTE